MVMRVMYGKAGLCRVIGGGQLDSPAGNEDISSWWQLLGHSERSCTQLLDTILHFWCMVVSNLYVCDHMSRFLDC